MPVLSHLVNGTVRDIYGVALASATVTLTHTGQDQTLPSVTSGSDGKYIINLSGLDSQWNLGDAISVTATKTAEGTKTTETKIEGTGGQTVNLTLAETSDLSYYENTGTRDQYNLNFVLLTHYDGEKVTRERPLPIQTEDPLDKYQPTDDDLSSDPNYTGFTDRFGNWYIVEDNLANGTHRYAKGSSDYPTNWTNKATLSYDYFYNVF